jgi:uncharacterized protein (DUF2141 family)
MIWLLLGLLIQQIDPHVETSDEDFEGQGIVIVEAVGFESDEGQAVVCLFSSESWSMPPNPGDALILETEQIEGLAVYTEIDGLAPSKYAILVFHDLDCDGELDGEDEPWGIFGGIPSMGPPSGSPPSDGGPPGDPPSGSPPTGTGRFLEVGDDVNVARIVVRNSESGGSMEMTPEGGPPAGGGGMPGFRG